MKALFEPCSEQDIRELEQHINATLPEGYRDFLLQWNGCGFVDNVPAFDLADSRFEEEYGTMDRLFGLPTKSGGADLRLKSSGYQFRERVPERFLAIGDNPYQEFVCISLAGDDRGSVFLWSPGEAWEPDENVPTMEYLYLAAKTFRQFFDSLRPNPNPLYR